jgi:hypothetical protein
VTWRSRAAAVVVALAAAATTHQPRSTAAVPPAVARTETPVVAPHPTVGTLAPAAEATLPRAQAAVAMALRAAAATVVRTAALRTIVALRVAQGPTAGTGLVGQAEEARMRRMTRMGHTVRMAQRQRRRTERTMVVVVPAALLAATTSTLRQVATADEAAAVSVAAVSVATSRGRCARKDGRGNRGPERCTVASVHVHDQWFCGVRMKPS